MPHHPNRHHGALRRGAVAAALVVLALGGTAACTSHGTSTADGASAAATRAGADPSSTAGAQAETGTGAGAGAGSAGTPKADPAKSPASETLPSQTPGPAGLLPVPAATVGPSLDGPLPATGAKNGALVAGFPTRVVPVPDGVTVVSSSVSSSGTRLQVGLQGSSAAAPADVQAAYVAALGGAGFTVGDSPALPGTTATAFTRGPDALVLTVRDRTGGGTELTIAGTLTTAG